MFYKKQTIAPVACSATREWSIIIDCKRRETIEMRKTNGMQNEIFLLLFLW